MAPIEVGNVKYHRDRRAKVSHLSVSMIILQLTMSSSIAFS